MKCSKCDEETSDLKHLCEICGLFIGYPNVRAVSAKEETDALEKRYRVALDQSDKKGALDNLRAFENAIKTTSVAVINMPLKALLSAAINDNELYSNYYLSVSAEVRRPATTDNDRKRRIVDAIMFGMYANQIRFAALSLNGEGLSSYGSFSLILKDKAINERASLLEDNSFEFVDTHSLSSKCECPPGYRCVWDRRNTLAVSKLWEKINPATTADQYATILLRSDGKRETDHFIEVHIYGALSKRSFTAIMGSSTAPKKEQVMIDTIKEMFQVDGVGWIET